MEQDQLMIQMSVDEVLREAISREKQLVEFYVAAIDEVGPDERDVLNHLLFQLHMRVERLERLLKETQELRSLTGSIAD